MKDFYDTEVKIGDTVVKITDKTVEVEYEAHWTSSPYKDTYRLMSDQFIIIGGY